MRTVCLVQARLGSTRLPGKVLMDLCGKPMLQHVVERASQIPGVDEVAVVTHWPDLSAISAALPGVKVLAYEDVADGDVLRRYLRAAWDLDADYVVRVTGDCPLLNPVVGGWVLSECHRLDTYTTNDTAHTGWPDGWDVQAFPIGWLEDADLRATGSDREHVCPWMDQQPGARVICVPKLSVDTAEDFERVRSILQQEQHADH